MVPSEIQPLIEALTPIKTYLSDMVLVGGWVPLLNKFFNPSYVYEGLPMMTKDVDLVCPRTLPVKEEEIDNLLTKAGFESQLYGEDTPPVCKYVKKEEIEIEFLTPMHGSEDERNIEVQRRLSAQSLRYLDILLNNTVVIPIPETDIEVKTPELAAFIYQKGLSFPSRTSDLKKAKDLYYIYQVLDSVKDVEVLTQSVRENIVPRYHQGWFKTFTRNLSNQFKSIDDIGVDSVLRQVKDLPDFSRDEAVEKRRIFKTFSDFIVALNSTA